MKFIKLVVELVVELVVKSAVKLVSASSVKTIATGHTVGAQGILA